MSPSSKTPKKIGFAWWRMGGELEKWGEGVCLSHMKWLPPHTCTYMKISIISRREGNLSPLLPRKKGILYITFKNFSA